MEAFLEDVFHAQTIKRFETSGEAVSELRRLEPLDWIDLQREIGPCPCSSNCGRRELAVSSGGRIVAEARPIDPDDEP
jgi:hypothetical protein